MSAEAPDPLLGQTIAGKYVVEAFLGGGAMGAVYRARQSALDKSVAVKVMHPEIARDPAYVARFEREARAASRLDHPNSVRVTDFGQDPSGLLYLVMEFLEGRSLYDVIHEDWPISPERIADILSQALAAIAVAHDMGVVHRDLKPENVMVLRAKDDDGRDIDVVKVCDFGIAKLTDGDRAPSSLPAGPGPAAGGPKLTTQGLVVGTPEYMSPEQAKGEVLDARSDLYSMGVILYQLLTGRTPFDGDNALSIVVKHVTEVPIPPSVIFGGVHRELEAVCLRAMQKPRDARYQTAREMRGELRAAVTPGTDPRISLTGAPSTATGRIPQSAIPTGVAPLSLPLGGALGPIAGTPAPPGTSKLEVAPTVVHMDGNTVSETAKRAALGAGPVPSAALPASTFTPASTSAALPKKRSPLPFVALAAVVVLGAGGAFGARQFLAGRTAAETPSSTTTTTATQVVASGASTPPVPVAANGTTAVAVQTAPMTGPTATGRDPKRTPAGTAAAATVTPTDIPHTEPTATPTAEPTPTPTQTAPPAPTPTQTAPPAPTPTQAPPFNANACAVKIGSVKSNGSVSTSQLRVAELQGPLDSCFKKSVAQKNATFSGEGTVSLDYDSDHTFRGAQLAGPAAGLPGLAACVKQSARATLKKSGDITGEPHFDIAVNFTCP